MLSLSWRTNEPEGPVLSESKGLRVREKMGTNSLWALCGHFQSLRPENPEFRCLEAGEQECLSLTLGIKHAFCATRDSKDSLGACHIGNSRSSLLSLLTPDLTSWKQCPFTCLNTLWPSHADTENKHHDQLHHPWTMTCVIFGWRGAHWTCRGQDKRSVLKASTAPVPARHYIVHQALISINLASNPVLSAP